MVKWFRIETRTAVYVLRVVDGRVKETAPIAKKFRGKPWPDVLKELQRYGAKVLELPG